MHAILHCIIYFYVDAHIFVFPESLLRYIGGRSGRLAKERVKPLNRPNDIIYYLVVIMDLI